MVGNDIVDLQSANQESRWKDPRFINKIFTPLEKIIIYNSDNEFETIWRLWSMKESAYKIHIQKNNLPFFNPQKIEASVVNDTRGFVIIENEKFLTVTEKATSYIYTIAESLNNKKVTSALLSVNKQSASAYCKAQLIVRFAELYNLYTNSLSLKKNSLGVPKLFYRNLVQNKSVSITHHGKFAGICFN